MKDTRQKLTKEKIIEILKKEFPYLKNKYGVEKIALFGSFAKGEQRKKSDIDILVDLEKPLGLDFIELADLLEKRLGRKVDVATFDCYKRSLNNPRYKHIAEDIKKNLIYV
ncbi:MAG: nucleotidyltransferase family protein [Nitrospirae bacterium]|jgi:predicted nucleotidyltransferase|nr:nucleotidyltransferase family protein [Nitrospirota bacterium]